MPNECACGCGTELNPYRRTYSGKGMIKGEYPKWARGHHMREPGYASALALGNRKPPRGCKCGCGKPVKGMSVWAEGCRIAGRGGRWKGGLFTTEQGYVTRYLPTHPNANSGGRVPEHRYVMETHLRRLLDSDESVHHINGDKSDNRIENLQIRRRHHGSGQAWACHDCGSSNVHPTRLAD